MGLAGWPQLLAWHVLSPLLLWALRQPLAQPQLWAHLLSRVLAVLAAELPVRWLRETPAPSPTNIHLQDSRPPYPGLGSNWLRFSPWGPGRKVITRAEAWGSGLCWALSQPLMEFMYSAQQPWEVETFPPHFPEKETEALSGEATGPRTPSQEVAEPEFGLRQS